MIGDCGRCGHSIIYHVPLSGCLKCSCEEFTASPRLVAIAALCLGLSCSAEKAPPDGAPSAAPPPPVSSATPAIASSAPVAASAAPSASATAALGGQPAFEVGAGVLRLGVMYSEEEATIKRDRLGVMIYGWPPIEVWRTKSGKDDRVTHRLQMSGVSPGAATALCDWIQQKGWAPGADECGLRD